MDRQALISFLGGSWIRTQEYICSSLSSDVSLLQRLNDGIICNAGKQLRPLLCLLMARVCADPSPDTVKLAAASEILHNATLIHDDVADGSGMRRGKPTMFSVLGANSAVLLGDFWLARAMELIIDTKCSSSVSKLFSTTLTDLAEGELLQLEKSASLDLTEEEYYRIIFCKTASLFVASSVSGVVSVGAPEKYVTASRKYATALGLAFQIRDDILDYTGGEKLGKPLGLDIKEKKITLPLLHALSGSAERDYILELVRDADKYEKNCELVRRFVLDSGGIDYATSRLDDYVSEAEAALELFPDCEARIYLKEIARFSALRSV